MSLDFLSAVPEATGGEPGGAPIARSPMEPNARAAGARFEIRHGWNVTINYGRTPAASEAEGAAARRACGWADVSHLTKLELQGPVRELADLVRDCAEGAEPELGSAARGLNAWWCPLTPNRVLVVGEPGAVAPLPARLTESGPDVRIVDVTTTLAALTLVGPLAREVFARFSALDLRPQSTPVGGVRPGSIARQPGIVICEAEERYLLMFGWATGEYVWSVVADAGHHLGGRAIGLEMLGELDGPGTGLVTEVSRA